MKVFREVGKGTSMGDETGTNDFANESGKVGSDVVHFRLEVTVEWSVRYRIRQGDQESYEISYPSLTLNRTSFLLFPLRSP